MKRFMRGLKNWRRTIQPDRARRAEEEFPFSVRFEDGRILPAESFSPFFGSSKPRSGFSGSGKIPGFGEAIETEDDRT